MVSLRETTRYIYLIYIPINIDFINKDSIKGRRGRSDEIKRFFKMNKKLFDQLDKISELAKNKTKKSKEKNLAKKHVKAFEQIWVEKQKEYFPDSIPISWKVYEGTNFKKLIPDNFNTVDFFDFVFRHWNSSLRKKFNYTLPPVPTIGTVIRSFAEFHSHYQKSITDVHTWDTDDEKVELHKQILSLTKNLKKLESENQLLQEENNALRQRLIVEQRKSKGVNQRNWSEKQNKKFKSWD